MHFLILSCGPQLCISSKVRAAGPEGVIWAQAFQQSLRCQCRGTYVQGFKEQACKPHGTPLLISHQWEVRYVAIADVREPWKCKPQRAAQSHMFCDLGRARRRNAGGVPADSRILSLLGASPVVSSGELLLRATSLHSLNNGLIMCWLLKIGRIWDYPSLRTH